MKPVTVLLGVALLLVGWLAIWTGWIGDDEGIMARLVMVAGGSAIIIGALLLLLFEVIP